MHSPKIRKGAPLRSRIVKISILVLVGALGLSGCPQLLCDFGLADLCETYTVTYSVNGADEGSAPVDGSEYEEGETVTVKGNTGGLSRTGYSFMGWNTAANGGGTSYSGGGTFTMEAANITLYAEWSEGEEGDSDIRPDAYEPDGAGQATELIPDGRIQENHTFHPTGTAYPVTTPEGTKYKGDEDNYYVIVDLDVGTRATLEIRTYGNTDTFLSLYAPPPNEDPGIAYGEEWISASVENSGRYMVLARHLDAYGGTGEYSISANLVPNPY